MSQISYNMGFRSSAEVIECSVSDLVAQYVGQTGPKVISKALGKVFFIGEAYRLDEGCFPGEAIDELVDCVTKTKFANKVIIILVRVNQGYRVDFPQRWYSEALSLVAVCNLFNTA